MIANYFYHLCSDNTLDSYSTFLPKVQRTSDICNFSYPVLNILLREGGQFVIAIVQEKLFPRWLVLMPQVRLLWLLGLWDTQKFNVLLNGAENLRATCYFFFSPQMLPVTFLTFWYKNIVKIKQYNFIQNLCVVSSFLPCSAAASYSPKFVYFLGILYTYTNVCVCFLKYVYTKSHARIYCSAICFFHVAV